MGGPGFDIRVEYCSRCYCRVVTVRAAVAEYISAMSSYRFGLILQWNTAQDIAVYMSEHLAFWFDTPVEYCSRRNEFTCPNSTECQPMSRWCDGVSHCHDNVDEESCGEYNRSSRCNDVIIVASVTVP